MTILNPNVMRDALKRLGYENSMPGDYDIVERMDVSIFPQTFSDTTCGMGGAGGQAITTGKVIVVIDNFHGKAVVYFGDHYAYLVPNIRGNTAFIKAWQMRQMPVRHQRSQVEGTI